ncbi:MAG: hypothetical protein BWY72_01881 [Bacteroidetes bacterium ADurb.Bin416]|nr:MAG: hypothetical protein BWY72_01881 [Bacteroidetes bacterium ADurb.Bin416]
MTSQDSRKGTFAGSIGTHDGMDFPFVHRQVDAPQYFFAFNRGM